MNYDVRAELDRPHQVATSSKSIVHDERNLVPVREVRERLEVRDTIGRVSDGLKVLRENVSAYTTVARLLNLQMPLVFASMCDWKSAGLSLLTKRNSTAILKDP